MHLLRKEEAMHGVKDSVSTNLFSAMYQIEGKRTPKIFNLKDVAFQFAEQNAIRHNQ